MAWWLYRAFVLSLMTGLAACVHCTYNYYSYYYYYKVYKYCIYGCCSTDCCSYSSSYDNTVSPVYTVDITAGNVISGILFIAGIIAVMIPIICCYIESQSPPGRVINLTPGTTGNLTELCAASHMSQARSALAAASALYGPQYGPQYGAQYGPQCGPQFSGLPSYSGNLTSAPFFPQ